MPRWAAAAAPALCAEAQILGLLPQPIAAQGRSYRDRASLDSKVGSNLRQSRILRMPIMKKQAHLHH
ncbi:hypothetical protein J3A69_000826 [Pseudomonas putida]|uniref:Uncharacterized protein n=1 Tax=Pseudomonas putida TaxID=303 RepID=A0A1L7NHU6_PSEPU|nr:hypothetical protein [Pseudomonas sp. PvP089]MBP2086620.1 hypothetical protein [Pseudomonas sp. PvP088]MBP2221219.1 hypothetical protein [Pseudomonas putida]BAW25013.1 Uncharacterized protein KF715C_ch44400 [Pseudomonas putida]GLO18838.1 hypothetical protein PPUJ20188_22330 [Pseudomonas putida]